MALNDSSSIINEFKDSNAEGKGDPVQTPLNKKNGSV